MRAIIFINGTVDDYSVLDHSLEPDDYLIAADGGVYHCLAINRTPHALVGDLDSVDPATVDTLALQHVHIKRYPAEKNETDLELALGYALSLANDHALSAIVLVGTMGGRLDQMLGNVLILAQREWPIPVLL
ncbi:MAG: thiamine diphosphokinase, partial [Caldilineaceae bacterium]|nr:thiamine diphosphokinase [Caldilineaceae bacterium]